MVARSANLASGLGWVPLVALLLVRSSQQAADPEAGVSHTGQCSWSKHGYPFPLGLAACPQQLTEDSSYNTGSWSPWTQRPHCLEPAYEINTPEYCVFTDNAYRGNRGLSMLTTPDMAAAVASMLDDTTVVPELLEMENKHRPWVVKNIRGRGKGVVARRFIEKWERIMINFPSVIVRTDYLDVLDEDEAKELRHLAVERLSKSQQKAILALAHSTGGELINDILKTNIFGIEIEGVPHMGLFNQGSVRKS